VGDVWGPFFLSIEMKRSSPAFSKKKTMISTTFNMKIIVGDLREKKG